MKFRSKSELLAPDLSFSIQNPRAGGRLYVPSCSAHTNTRMIVTPPPTHQSPLDTAGFKRPTIHLAGMEQRSCTDHCRNGNAFECFEQRNPSLGSRTSAWHVYCIFRSNTNLLSWGRPHGLRGRRLVRIHAEYRYPSTRKTWVVFAVRGCCSTSAIRVSHDSIFAPSVVRPQLVIRPVVAFPPQSSRRLVCSNRKLPCVDDAQLRITRGTSPLSCRGAVGGDVELQGVQGSKKMY